MFSSPAPNQLDYAAGCTHKSERGSFVKAPIILLSNVSKTKPLEEDQDPLEFHLEHRRSPTAEEGSSSPLHCFTFAKYVKRGFRLVSAKSTDIVF